MVVMVVAMVADGVDVVDSKGKKGTWDGLGRVQGISVPSSTTRGNWRTTVKVYVSQQQI